MTDSPLFRPFQVKSLTLKNRLVMAPMTRSHSPEGIPTDAVAQYYQRRAAGEVGLILSEGTVIDRPSSSNDPNVPRFHGEKALNAWQNVINAVHKAGGKMGPQIWHVGAVKAHKSGNFPTAPMEGPETMSLADIEAAIKGYASAAADAKRLGFDTVELHGAHGYLIDQFFWEGMNKRADAYGGKTIKERNRFAIDVVKAVRAAIGPDLPLILRLSQWKQQDFNAKVAHTPKEMEDWLLPLSDAGVDIFHCSQRRFWETEFPDSPLNFAGWAKKITGKPTITVGSIGLDGEFIASFRGAGAAVAPLDEILERMERGEFDLVAVGRALLTDPEWPKKIKEKRFGELKGFDKDHLAVLT